MAKIQQLYRVEREIKSLNHEERHKIRQRRSVPLLNEFRQWLDEHLPIVPPRSALRKAMQYAHKQWDKLTAYSQDGRLKIDNNLTENAIRPFSHRQKKTGCSATRSQGQSRVRTFTA